MGLRIIEGIVSYGGKFGKGSCPALLSTGLPVGKRQRIGRHARAVDRAEERCDNESRYVVA